MIKFNQNSFLITIETSNIMIEFYNQFNELIFNTKNSLKKYE